MYGIGPTLSDCLVKNDIDSVRAILNTNPRDIERVSDTFFDSIHSTKFCINQYQYTPVLSVKMFKKYHFIFYYLQRIFLSIKLWVGTS